MSHEPREEERRKPENAWRRELFDRVKAIEAKQESFITWKTALPGIIGFLCVAAGAVWGIVKDGTAAAVTRCENESARSVSAAERTSLETQSFRYEARIATDKCREDISDIFRRIGKRR